MFCIVIFCLIWGDGVHMVPKPHMSVNVSHFGASIANVIFLFHWSARFPDYRPVWRSLAVTVATKVIDDLI